MSSNKMYLPVIFLLLGIVNIGGGIILLGLYGTNVASAEQARFFFMLLNFLIGIVVMSFILYEGKKYVTTYVITILFIASRIIDLYRYSVFPNPSFEINLAYMWSGTLIFIFAFVYLNIVIFKQRFAVYMMCVGLLIMIRVLYGADLFLFYVNKYVIMTRENIVYFTGVMIVYYAMLFFLILALIEITKDNFYYKINSNKEDFDRTKISS